MFDDTPLSLAEIFAFCGHQGEEFTKDEVSG